MIWTIVGALAVVFLVVCFLFLLSVANEEIERARAECGRLAGLLKVQAAANERLRERVRQLGWEKAHIWRWILDGAGEAE